MGLERRRGPWKVLVVDDSAVVRQAMQTILDADPDLEVIGVASDPLVAAERIRRQVPDVITLDVEMPRMDGITFLRRLMAQKPIPVVICSTLVTDRSETLAQALDAGAVDIVLKPELGIREFFEEACTTLCDTVKAAAQARLQIVRRPKTQKKLSADAMLAPPVKAMARTTEKVIAIGASTGGTEALRVVLESLPIDCPPTLVVQHMPETFTAAFARRLDSVCDVTVREARSGDRMLRGHVLIAPGNHHTLLTRSGANYGVEVKDGPLVSRHRPSVDVMFRSVAQYAGKNAVGVIMTGMGDDGAKGLLEMREAGARTLGQSEESCVVYGMPKEAMKAGGVEEEVHLDRIAAAIRRLSAA
ncbi:chemotaxis response regulator protein-glutamate methylesterase [Phaeobacter sp. QD34_3]|uniref:protein-glutamate methylesterase/protein-glutamine glutaminase n=1 Tax=unclassified Phaeobacter TaxID=2621772 RepID=UPI00237F25DE|nr:MULTISPECIES: chemotaxis response regulator protein-glutamate methylesterase [unclassified Phaeobacter]MDE4133895.1 chemotaxis response regulator protein-glutamate methylesterase [Phaeobacter sp. QD34_3]MDE4137648.1 chemotaxis response regulator protein-glutamate methylesterase [Phaeobacter sp. QD34_24]